MIVVCFWIHLPNNDTKPICSDTFLQEKARLTTLFYSTILVYIALYTTLRCTLKWDVQFKIFLYAELDFLSQMIWFSSLDIESLSNYTFGYSFKFAALQKNIVKTWGKSLSMISVLKDLLSFTWLSKYVLLTCH